MSPHTAERLRQLQQLRSDGALSDDEFETEKAALLRRGRTPRTAIALATIGVVAAATGVIASRHMLPTQDSSHVQSNTAANNSASVANEASGLTFKSSIKGAALVSLGSLPAPPTKPSDDIEECTDCYVQPQTPGGKSASAEGWHVVQEAKVGNLDAVLIAQRMGIMPAARIFAENGNLALYSGARLVGILYGKGHQGIDMASLQQIGDRVRVWSGVPETLQGEVALNGNIISFSRVIAPDRVCHGQTVPTVFDDEYAAARVKLVKAGWQPLLSRHQAIDPTPNTAEARFAETEQCSGMGYGLCTFLFKAAAAPVWLRVSAYGEGENPVVSGYAVSCEHPFEE